MSDPAAHEPTVPGGPADRVLNRAEVREQMRQQMLAGFGGWTGMAISAAPTVVFVVVNTISSLRTAVIAALASALVLVLYRLARKQPIQQAANGLFGVVIAAAIAARTGQARGYFLIGIWSSFAYGAVFLGSMVVRRPLVGVIWEFLDPTPSNAPQPSTAAGRGGPDLVAGTGSLPGDHIGAGTPWYRRPVLARAYLLATAAATAIFALRGVVQLSLFRQNSTGWLAVARIAMGYPLTIAAIGFAWLVVRRARARLSSSTQ